MCMDLARISRFFLFISSLGTTRFFSSFFEGGDNCTDDYLLISPTGDTSFLDATRYCGTTAPVVLRKVPSSLESRPGQETILAYVVCLSVDELPSRSWHRKQTKSKQRRFVLILVFEMTSKPIFSVSDRLTIQFSSDNLFRDSTQTKYTTVFLQLFQSVKSEFGLNAIIQRDLTPEWTYYRIFNYH